MSSLSLNTKTALVITGAIVAIYGGIVLWAYVQQRAMLYFPSHHSPATDTDLHPWMHQGELMGYAREVAAPTGIWLMLHGNAGQAASRDYVLPILNPRHSLYVMEYPGFGSRTGQPSRESFNAAASACFQALRHRFPGVPLGVLGESIGSGPACMLAQETPRPDALVLAVPFDQLTKVVHRHLPFVPTSWLLKDRWDNIEALRGFTGPVTIYAAIEDRVIPYERAAALAASVTQATLVPVEGGHNNWTSSKRVILRFPEH